MGHLNAYKVFLRSRYKIGIFLGLLEFQIIFRVLDIPDIFGVVNSRCWGRVPPPMGVDSFILFFVSSVDTLSMLR